MADSNEERQRRNAKRRARYAASSPEQKKFAVQRARAWKLANPDKVRASQRSAERRRSNVTRVRKWREENPERAKELSRRVYEKYRERAREKRRAWKEANPERKRELNRESRRRAYARDPEKYRVAARDYYYANTDAQRDRERVRRARVAGAAGRFTQEEFAARRQQQGNLCFYCRVPLEMATADHVLPLSRGGANDISNIVAACKACNCSKHTRTLAEFRPDLVLAFVELIGG